MPDKPHSMSVAVLRAFITNKDAGESAIMGALDDLVEQLEAAQYERDEAVKFRLDAAEGMGTSLAFIAKLERELEAAREALHRCRSDWGGARRKCSRCGRRLGEVA